MTIARNALRQEAAAETDELRLQIADAEFLTVFLSLHGAERAARWRGLNYGAKFRVVARQIEAKGGDWDVAMVEGWIAHYDARYSLGPVEAAVEGALERLAQQYSTEACLSARIHDKAATREARRYYTAFTNALIAYRSGVRPELLDSGAWLLPSRRAGEPPHILTMDGDWTCCCPAHSSMHWPIALIVGQEVAHDDMQAFDDPAPESELDAALERTATTLAAMRLSLRLCAAGRFDLRAA